MHLTHFNTSFLGMAPSFGELLHGSLSPRFINYSTPKDGNVFQVLQKSLPEVVGEYIIQPLINAFRKDEISATESRRKLTTMSSATGLVGEIIAVPFETVPIGFLECNGQSVDRNQFLDLFNAIGSKYGLGSTINTFKLPDLRGYFLRGWDHGAGNDPDASTRTDSGDGTKGDRVGTRQPHQFQTHWHWIPRDWRTPGSIDGTGAGSESGGTPSNDGLQSGGYDFKTLLNSDGGGKQTNPINMNVMFIIRVFPVSPNTNLDRICDSTGLKCVETNNMMKWAVDIDNIKSNITATNIALSNEIQTRVTMFQNIQQQINSEIATRSNLGNTLQLQIDNLKTNDQNFQQQISTDNSANEKSISDLNKQLQDLIDQLNDLQRNFDTIQSQVNTLVPENLKTVSSTQDTQSAQLLTYEFWLISLTIICGLQLSLLIFFAYRKNGNNDRHYEELHRAVRYYGASSSQQLEIPPYVGDYSDLNSLPATVAAETVRTTKTTARTVHPAAVTREVTSPC